MGKLKEELKTKWFWFRVSVICIGVLATVLYLKFPLSDIPHLINTIIGGFMGGLVVWATIKLIKELRNSQKGGKH